MICVHCGCPIDKTYRIFPGDNIRLATCSHCGKHADPYIETDNVIKFLDLILHKTAIYRHVMFNQIPYRDRGIDIKILQMTFIILIFNTYSKVVSFLCSNEKRIHCEGEPMLFNSLNLSFSGYLSIIFSSCFDMLVYLTGVIISSKMFIYFFYKSVKIFKYNYLIMSLLFSSFGKIFLIFPLIFGYNTKFFWIVELFVLTSNALSISVILDADVLSSSGIILFAYVF
ncbi:sterol homeostasis protein [Anaeramoeba flamelloides]|uniref:Protein ARV n=1 Tax=Anaeramoeba flamelloides TaxID=1746091 RepID=A0AAV7Y7K8_9EUKA|nr:sterol homeostasis protein [Anaeramoeba flamelloides]